MDRFRRQSIWTLQVSDVIKYRAAGRRMRGRITELTRNPQDGSVSGTLATSEGATACFRFTAADKVSRRLLTLDQIIAELDEPPDEQRRLV